MFSNNDRDDKDQYLINFQVGVNQRPCPWQASDASPAETVRVYCQCQGQQTGTHQTRNEYHHYHVTSAEPGSVGGAGEWYHGNEGTDDHGTDTTDYGDYSS